MCVCRATGMNAQCPLKPFVLQIYTVLPLFPLPISPLLVRQRMQFRAYNSRARLGSFPCSLCHQNSQRYTSLAASLQPKAFFKSVRDSCSRPGSCKSLLRLFGWILFGFREVWAEWCMIQCTGNHTRIGCYRHDSVQHAMLHLSAFSLNHHIITPFKGNFNGFLVKVNGPGAGREF